MVQLFFWRGDQEIAYVNYQKGTRGVHLIILPVSPCPANTYEIWHMRSYHQHNHMCQIFSQLVQWLRSCDTPKLHYHATLGL